jgi:hypothetical protein
MATAHIGQDRLIPLVQNFSTVARLASRGTVAATEAVALGDDGVLGVIGLPESAFAQLQCPRRGFRCNEIRPGKHGILRGYDAVPDIVHQEHDR